MFISKHRRLSRQQGHGVQYLPGHVDPFVDLVIGDYLPSEGEILDLGGGGLRFALPVALLGRRVTVVDVDPTGLDVEMVVHRVNENDGTDIDPDGVSPLLDLFESDLLGFLRANTRRFDLITAFRVVHFLRRDEISELARLANQALRADGVFVFSAMTPYNISEGDEFNEVFLSSEPVSSRSPLYRRFRGDPDATAVRKGQNLGEYVHLVDLDFVKHLARRSGFDLVVSGFRSTRIVAGFVLRRLNGVFETTRSR